MRSIHQIDKEQYRYNLASIIISGFCSNPSVFRANDHDGWALVNCNERQLAEYAVKIADEMISALGS